MEIHLPDTCPENSRGHYTHLRLLSRVNPRAMNGAGFEGALFRPGARIVSSERPLVAVEYAGPQGSWRRRRDREHLWVLWRYDWAASEWVEIARALAFGCEWARVLREAAIDALRRPEGEGDAVQRGREVADGLMRGIDEALVFEPPAVRARVLASIYDRMAGRIAAAA